MSSIRILLADDHALVRQSLRALLKKANNVEVVGEAHDGLNAVELVESLQPDLVIMDVSMPRLDGITATRRIMEMNGNTHVLILSMHANETLAQQALRMGARGYLLKRSVSEELLPAIQQVINGEVVLSRALATTY